jgi:hypothetical protein
VNYHSASAPWLHFGSRSMTYYEQLSLILPPVTHEVQAILTQVRGVHHLMASLLYGAGLRLMEHYSSPMRFGNVTIDDGRWRCARIVYRRRGLHLAGGAHQRRHAEAAVRVL